MVLCVWIARSHTSHGTWSNCCYCFTMGSNINPRDSKAAALLRAAAEASRKGETLFASDLAHLALKTISFREARTRRTLKKMFNQLKKKPTVSKDKRKYVCCEEFKPTRTSGNKTWHTNCLVRDHGKYKLIPRFVQSQRRPKAIFFKKKKVRQCTPELKEMYQVEPKQKPRK